MKVNVKEVKRMGRTRKKPDTDHMKSLVKDGRKKFVRYDEGAILYSVGLNTFRKMAQDAGALYHLGRTVLVNTELVDEYLEHFRDEY